MKAKIHHRVNIENHVVLGKMVPLSTPYVLLVDPSNLCNLRCRFCPTGDRNLIKKTGRYQGNLDFNVFKKIITDLKDFSEPVRVLRLYKEGEPLINPHFSEMIKYSKDSGFVQRVDTTTNGVLLNPSLNRNIIQAGLDQINISVNGVDEEHIYKYTGARINFSKYVDNIRDLYEKSNNCEVSIKGIKENFSEHDQDKFFRIFGDISDRIYLESLSPAWPDFTFNDLEMKFECGNYGQEIKERKICPYIFYIMVINSDGRASLCVGDWRHDLIYGDIKEQTVKEVWQGNIMKSHRMAHLENRRSENDFCRVCQVVSHGTLDNLDPFAEEIRQRLK